MLDPYTKVRISKFFEKNKEMICDQVFPDGEQKEIICVNKYEVFDYVNDASDYDFYMPI